MQMSKGQKRSNREPKKPKQTKQKIPVAAAALVTPPTKPDASARSKKKW
jgi:hypothetical protein